MKIVELTMQDFNNFAENHPLRNYCQTSIYAKLAGEKGFNYDYIGYKDDSNNLVAASLILNKKIGSFKFCYAPKGVLIDYYNNDLLKMFFNDLVEYYKHRGYAFLKINPEIIIGEVNKNKGFMPVYNQNVNIIDVLKQLGFKRRREVTPLDFLVPRLNPYINLKKFKVENLEEDVREKIKVGSQKGLFIQEGTNKDIGVLYDILKNDTFESINYFRNVLNTFNNDNSELLLLKVDYEEYLIAARKAYEKEQDNNNYWNERIQIDNSEENLNAKMKSDRDLLAIKDEIVSATDGIRRHKFKYIGGALVIKFKNRVSIILSGYDKAYKDLYPNYFIYDYLIRRYKDKYDFLDLNGLASNFSTSSIYSDFNYEKLDFEPTIYEFIGEFDLILNDFDFKRIQAKNLLAKEFYPSHKFEEKKN